MIKTVKFFIVKIPLYRLSFLGASDNIPHDANKIKTVLSQSCISRNYNCFLLCKSVFNISNKSTLNIYK